MNDENEMFEAEILDSEIDATTNDYDPNVVLNAIMQSQDMGLRSVLMKLSTLNVASKAALICMLFKTLNYVGVAALLYSIYCIVYVLINYKKINGNEHVVQDLFAKNGKTTTIKKIIIINILIALACIPLAILSFWYYYVFQVS